MIIGIDNGLKGALVALSGDGSFLFSSRMPTEMNTQCGKNEVKLEEVLSIVRRWEAVKDRTTTTTIVIEEPLHAAGSSQSLRSMAMSFGGIRGILIGNGYKVVRMQVGEWQYEMIGRGPKGTSKVRALAAAKKIWSLESFIPARGKTEHDGIVDAALIAEYYRINYVREKM
jgi:hypothetical protein